MCAENRMAEGEKTHCTAFCPKCGSDLFYLGEECICKNKLCGWHCGGCDPEPYMDSVGDDDE